MIDWPILIAIIMFLGLILLLLEIFVVPGFGPVGVMAIIFLALGTYLSWTRLNAAWGMGASLASILLLVISLVILKKSGASDKLVLKWSIGEKAAQDHAEPHGKAGNREPPDYLIAVGETGMTLSDLRPSGIGEFNDCRLNIIADGIYIKRNTPIRIVRIEGNRIFVEEET
ncbi:MAG: NfeD family protein [bacterium]